MKEAQSINLRYDWFQKCWDIDVLEISGSLEPEAMDNRSADTFEDALAIARDFHSQYFQEVL